MTYGFDAELVETILGSITADPNGNHDYSFPAGSNLGFDVTYDLSYDGGNGVHVIIVSVSDLAWNDKAPVFFRTFRTDDNRGFINCETLLALGGQPLDNEVHVLVTAAG